MLIAAAPKLVVVEAAISGWEIPAGLQGFSRPEVTIGHGALTDSHCQTGEASEISLQRRCVICGASVARAGTTAKVCCQHRPMPEGRFSYCGGGQMGGLARCQWRPQLSAKTTTDRRVDSIDIAGAQERLAVVHATSVTRRRES